MLWQDCFESSLFLRCISFLQELIKIYQRNPIRVIYIYSFFIFNGKIKADLLKVIFT